MKNPKYLLLLVAAVTLFSCNKSPNNGYSPVDHTVGMVKMRTWWGAPYGYAPKDTVAIIISPGDTVRQYAAHYSRFVKDTDFAITKYNTFEIQIGGVYMNYRKTDSANGIVLFDTVFGTAHRTSLTYYFKADTCVFEYHKVGAQDPVTGIYYEDDVIWYGHPKQ